jgi:hypothetical protein
MPEFQYDELISTEVDRQRRYWLDELQIDAFTLAHLGAGALLMMQEVKREYPDWTGSEDYSDLFDSIGVVYKWYGNRMLDNVYSSDDNYRPEDYKFRDMEDLHLSLSTIEQFGLIKFLKKGK